MADALHGGIEHRVQVGVAAGPELLQGLVAPRHRRFGRGRDDLGLDFLVDGDEEGLLVAEVVLQGAARHAGQRDDLLPAGSGVPLGREELTGRADEGGPGRLRSLRLRPPRPRFALDHACSPHALYMRAACTWRYPKEVADDPAP